jgi:2-amino-4-hydroxy-6-hydroxymethyldihydropteridine diphosphokinase
MLRERVTLRTVSSVYESEPVGYADQPAFCNLVAEVETSLTAKGLLHELITIEQAMGRQRTFRNAPRIIDLDILLFGDAVQSTPELTIPHPRMTERAFVLRPLVELSPQLMHPTTGDLFADILANGTFERVEKLARLDDV